ncbi:MAG: response regulator, partial [Verrucomicrobiales bacterium]|nr:response regulator [Verrucomicrobiales bacterium]
FENSVEGIFQTSPEGRFIRVNPAFARIYGYSSPEELVVTLTDVRTQVYVDPRRREEFVRLVLDQGSITGFESEIYRRDGSVIWVSESARVVRDREGRLAYFEGTLEDISVRKQVDAEREKASRAALESARLKSEFVATVSHEIRTPLNAIVPNAERLLESRLDSQQRYLVESIDHGAHMLLQIVNDILDLSRVEAGAVSLECIDFDLHEVLERTISFFASRAHDKGLEWVGDIRPGVPHRVCGDPARLTQILNNLAGNALKFTEAGEVVMQVEAAQTTDEGVQIVIRVRDTGIGIAPEARDRVFQAFAQADGSMSRRYGGTGLGLAISRKFVELMGGTIDFTSEVGKGTTFSVTVHLEWPRHAEPEPVLPRVLGGRRTLVLEDNASQGAAIAATLSNVGAESVILERRLEEALAHLQRSVAEHRPIDLVFYDTELPGVDAIHTARRLRAAGGAALRIIALTVPGVIADARGLEAAGITGLLIKPLRQSRVAAELQQILRAPEPGGGPAPMAMPAESAARPGEGLQVLLVEDHPLNQRVAGEMLDRLGARVDAVDSGPLALEAVRRKRYDLVLMDCQMPDMDGYETTRRLREWERAGAAHGRIAVVALSANALSGDRERGLAAGMDDYLTKPLRQPEMVRILRRVAESRQSGGSAVQGGPLPSVSAVGSDVLAPTPTSTPTSASPGPVGGSGAEEPPVLDPEPLQALSVPDDPTVLSGFVQQFLGDTPGRLAKLRVLVESGDAVVLRREAHTLKGSSSYMGARRLVAACARMESQASTASRPELEALLDSVVTQFEEARAALLQHLARIARDA